MSDLTIAIDVMGGDQGPLVTLPAAMLAIEKSADLKLILCGDNTLISNFLQQHQLEDHPRLSIKHTTDVVTMDEKPSSALRTKKDSSMRKAIDFVHSGQAHACVSAGNTGALFSIAHFVLKTLSTVERPALISALPTHHDDKHVFMLDLGANVFCDSSVLYQFGVMGTVMAEQVEGINKPRVALLNMGVEEIKGSDHIKMAATLLSENPDINYVGFIEGNDIFNNKADVIVCDGFVGNVALKTCEGVARLVYQKLKSVLSQHIFARLLGRFFAPTLKKLFKALNPDQYNGASLIGLRGIVIKSHGNAGVTAFTNAIFEAMKEVERQVPEKITKKLEHGITNTHLS
ncbi:phosphate acyltransferase PlsX [Thalassotalea sp. 1_MG-2023]|uniref:phosphate acyltransferase PlsX n=1 Tax=Thalassotalea sp. 1_MG-2023 TaxID=3062680 RepID=UPI0026E3AEC9|nr:phosphate acyltransferase PlsX [Thalassotalea sp. 1_MG-2023]MDO6426934.1 phosphate acyltransferase PlsX [Thalassotalea sp. 1_MG-2023]